VLANHILIDLTVPITFRRQHKLWCSFGPLCNFLQYLVTCSPCRTDPWRQSLCVTKFHVHTNAGGKLHGFGWVLRRRTEKKKNRMSSVSPRTPFWRQSRLCCHLWWDTNMSNNGRTGRGWARLCDKRSVAAAVTIHTLITATRGCIWSKTLLGDNCYVPSSSPLRSHPTLNKQAAEFGVGTWYRKESVSRDAARPADGNDGVLLDKLTVAHPLKYIPRFE
jgi:hypothetical protein